MKGVTLSSGLPISHIWFRAVLNLFYGCKGLNITCISLPKVSLNVVSPSFQSDRASDGRHGCQEIHLPCVPEGHVHRDRLDQAYTFPQCIIGPEHLQNL